MSIVQGCGRRLGAAVIGAVLGLGPATAAFADCGNDGSGFANWLKQFKAKAAAEGISQATLASALGGVAYDRTVIHYDRNQKSFKLSFEQFYARRVGSGLIRQGQSLMRKHKATFDRVEKRFGVPPSIIVAIWGLETGYGADTSGKFSIIRSLATLAYDCRRSPFFTGQLMDALRIVQRGDMTPAELRGGWAGEIGQTQFLPTRYLEHAIDYDGDGRPDLFSNPTDIIGTTANYMSHLGWRPNEPWIEEVRVSHDLPWEQTDLAVEHPRSKWADWGVTKADGSPLETDSMPASLLLPMGRHGPAFLAFPNFRVYLQWNQSLNYAITAAYLANRIDGAAQMRRGRGDIPVLGIEEAKELQRLLAARGFDVGEIDGLIGQKSRIAVKEMQIKLNLPADAYPTPELLSALRRGS